MTKHSTQWFGTTTMPAHNTNRQCINITLFYSTVKNHASFVTSYVKTRVIKIVIIIHNITMNKRFVTKLLF